MTVKSSYKIIACLTMDGMLGIRSLLIAYDKRYNARKMEGL